jgi:hypothetical protein
MGWEEEPMSEGGSESILTCRSSLSRATMPGKEITMGAREGAKLRSILTGKVYELKTIKDWAAVLESLDGTSQVWTERDNLELFYERVEESYTDFKLSPARQNDGETLLLT